MQIELVPRSLRRARWSARVPQVALMASCAALTAAGLRAVVERPAAAPASARATEPVQRHDTTDAIAEAFARAYLTWDGRSPGQRVAAVRRFSPQLADALDSETDTAPAGRQSVTWTAVSQDEAATGAGRRVTVLADTTSGPTALAVTVAQAPGQGLRIDGYPALVGLPHVAQAEDDPPQDPVDDAGLAATVSRAVRNYVGARRDALAADLLPGAVVVTPAAGMSVASIDDITWTQHGREVAVAVHARLTGGGELALGYELGVVRQAGRWFVRWIENQPTGGSR